MQASTPRVREAVEAALLGLGAEPADFEGGAGGDPPHEAALLVVEAGPAALAGGGLGWLRGAGLPAVVVAPRADTEVVLAALRAGAVDFAVAPGDPGELEGVLARALAASPRGRARGRVVALLGAGGGCGVTTAAIGLAELLARERPGEVILVDLSLQHGGVRPTLGLDPGEGVDALLADLPRLDRALLEARAARHPAGFAVIGGSGDLRDPESVKPEALARLLDLLRRSHAFAVVDLPRSPIGRVVPVLQAAEPLLLFVPPRPAALVEARAVLDFLGELGGARARVEAVLAGSHRAAALRPRDLADALDLPGCRELRVDARAARRAELEGVPVTRVAPRSRVARDLRSLARWLRVEGARPDEGAPARGGPEGTR